MPGDATAGREGRGSAGVAWRKLTPMLWAVKSRTAAWISSAVAGAVGGGQDERGLVRAVLETAVVQHHAGVFGHRPVRRSHHAVRVPHQCEGLSDLRCGGTVRWLGLDAGALVDRVQGPVEAGQHTTRDRGGGPDWLVGYGDAAGLVHVAEVVRLEPLGLERGEPGTGGGNGGVR